MNKTQYTFSAPKTLVHILVYFLLFLAGEICSSLVFDPLFSLADLPNNAPYIIARMTASLLLTLFFFWLYTTRVLHVKMADFGITANIRTWGVIIAVLLPVSVAAVFALFGTFEVSALSAGEICLTIAASMLIALKTGITEEVLFRGYIMKLLDMRWNRPTAIVVPSFVFSLLHIFSMESFSASGIVLLLISGTVVGIMFSLVSYKGMSVGNVALLHTVWNLILATDILHITTAQGAYGRPIFLILLSSDNVLLTGADFGIEASIIAVTGYVLVCGLMLIPKKQQ